ncbi:hypothetical protein CHARACLAT_020472 [Characodon lateralis]|uniref:Uncharacterized protein n=1 Tax=Characodon lateralis TaxID=208331 RepID=A0ABU7EVJ8_9TELE|nr:hypothetical protein [Characodon lateralis]
MVAQWVPMLPCSKKVLGSNRGLGSFCIESHMFCLCRYSSFLLQSKNITVRLTGYSKLSLRMSVSFMVVLCVSAFPCDGPVTCPGCTPPLTKSQLEIGTSSAVALQGQTGVDTDL